MPSSLALAFLVESVLAVVDGRPLMLSEVRLVQALRGIAEGPALEALIDERLMFREAVRLPQAAVSPEEEERAYQGLSGRVGATVGEDALRRLARRQTAIVKYIDFRFRPQIRITDEAVKTAYEAEYGGRADAPDLSAVQETLRERLVRRALDDKIEAWVKELRASADVQYVRAEGRS
jgi:hypothetical protein